MMHDTTATSLSPSSGGKHNSLSTHEHADDETCSSDDGKLRRRRSSLEEMALSVRQGIAQSTSHWRVLVMGQVLSFLLACSGAAQATLHLSCSLSAPAFATGLIYFCLSFFLLFKCCQTCTRRQDPIIHYRETRDPSLTPRYSFLRGRVLLHSPVWAYFCMALLDVEANYLTVLAFRFTTLTSVTLFDALAIPSAMVLSKLFLKRAYVVVHLIGAVVCMTGIVVNVLTDYESDQEAAQDDDNVVDDKEEEEYPHKLLGDILAITGGLIYGANNVLQEYVVKSSGGPMEFLGMLGFFGLCISIVQVLILERHDVAAFFNESMVRGGGQDDDESTCGIAAGIFLLLGYVASLTLGYVGGSYFLVVSEAALLNLSLLTGDLWSVTFSIVAERIVPSSLFFVALVLIVSGVLLYETGPTPIVSPNDSDSHNVMMASRVATSEASGALEVLEEKAWEYDNATEELELSATAIS